MDEVRTPQMPTARQRRSVVRRFVPPQHGAWAMLVVPYLAGLIAAGYRWPDIPLLGAWLGGYSLSYYVFTAIKSRRPRRYRDQLLCYTAVTAPLAALVVAARPQVLAFAPAYAVLIAVNIWYAVRRDERALLNDIAAVLQSCLMVLVVATVAAVPVRTVAVAFALCLMYFLGTVWYVKTMIRERDNPAYLRWSIGYHMLALVAAVPLGVWAAALFAWLLVRAALLPRRGLAPKPVGLIEFGNCVLLLAVVALS